MKKITAIGVKEQDKSFRVTFSKEFRNNLDSLPKGRYKITVEKYYKNKSNPQLGYLFSVIYPLVLQHLNDAGWEYVNVEQVDIKLKSMFSGQEILNRNTGEIDNIPALKRDMSTVQMNTYIDAIRVWDAEYLGGIIPEPGENFKINWKELKNK